MQIYGGYGFTEEYSAAQQYRDARIYPIWEGTNYIQSMDLVGRKMTMKKGEVFGAWMKHITDFVGANQGAAGFEKEFEILLATLGKYMGILKTLQGLIAL